MNLKNLLKTLKLNESTISMVFGAFVIIVVGVLLVNFFQDDEGDTIPSITTEQGDETIHTVAEGEDLWKISERYYGTGFNWSAIAEANDISDPNTIETGQSLVIPESVDDLAVTSPTVAQMSPTMTNSPTPTIEVVEKEQVDVEEGVNEYVVAKGDSLWTIAEKVYGDGHRWVDIATENELVNPNIIHSGNRFRIPRP